MVVAKSVEVLAGIFAVDVLSFAVMSNDLHVVILHFGERHSVSYPFKEIRRIEPLAPPLWTAAVRCRFGAGSLLPSHVV